MGKRGGYPGGMPNNMNMNNLMKQAQKMQKQMEETARELETKEYKATAGGGAIEVTVSGKHRLKEVTLAEEIVDPDDIEMLQDLIIAAANEALEAADQDSTSAFSGLAGGLGGSLPF